MPQLAVVDLVVLRTGLLFARWRGLALDVLVRRFASAVVQVLNVPVFDARGIQHQERVCLCRCEVRDYILILHDLLGLSNNLRHVRNSLVTVFDQLRLLRMSRVLNIVILYRVRKCSVSEVFRIDRLK